VVLMMGINDIGWPGTILVPRGEPAPAADDVIIGYQQLIARAHAHDMRILGVTLTPFEDTFQPMHIRGRLRLGRSPPPAGYGLQSDGRLDRPGALGREAVTPDAAGEWAHRSRPTPPRGSSSRSARGIVRHGRYVLFQLAEVAVPRALFAEILRRIDRLRPTPPPLPA
jgi:hypothetical protein